MNTKPDVLSQASKWYERLVCLYPPSYLAKHREELLQNFKDLQRDVGSKKLFWVFVASDFIKSLTQQYMEYLKHHLWAQIAAIVIIILAAVAIWQSVILHKAHSSFANYAAFRGCSTITSQTDTSGTCTLASGTTIKIIKFRGKWYLNNDLPVCFGNFCF